MTELAWELLEWYRQFYSDQKWIPLEEMKIGRYLCDARNFAVGYWNGNEFEYERTKWNCKFDDTEEHYDRGSPFGTVKPIRYLGEESL